MTARPQPDPGPPELSVVVPLHNEAPNVEPLCEAIRSAMESTGRAFEVLLVDDGSTDLTRLEMERAAAVDPRFRPVLLARNFGQAAALSTGFELARGRFVLTLDGDLQNDPADLPRLLQVLEDGGYRVVSGWRRQRQEEFARRTLPSRIANGLIAGVTGFPSRDNGCSLKVYRAEAVKGVYLPKGFHRFLPAVLGVRPAEFTQIPVADHPRRSGRSHYGLSRTFLVLRDLVSLAFLPGRVPDGLTRARRCLSAGAMGMTAGLVAALGGAAGMAVTLLLAGLSLAAYGETLRGGLGRWQEAQVERTARYLATLDGRRAPRLSLTGPWDALPDKDARAERPVRRVRERART